jgi:hypothetical protein
MNESVMNPFAMLLDATAAIHAHQNVLTALRKQVHKRADALPRHLQAEVVEFDKAVDMAATTGGRLPSPRPRVAKPKHADAAAVRSGATKGA